MVGRRRERGCGRGSDHRRLVELCCDVALAGGYQYSDIFHNTQ